MHKVEVVGPAQKSLIPSAASAAVSVRIVPDQSLEAMIDKLTKHLEAAFATLRTENKLTVSPPFASPLVVPDRLVITQIDITQTADWVCSIS